MILWEKTNIFLIFTPIYIKTSLVEYLKKIIAEEINKAYSLITENNLTVEPGFEVFSSAKNSTDNIIYNYEKGREFATNILQTNIDNLNSYFLSDYLPNSVKQEKWGFEFDTTMGSTLMVDITRDVVGGNSFWTMIFSILYKGENLPIIKDMVESVDGFDNFIKVVNSGIAKKIDVSKN